MLEDLADSLLPGRGRHAVDEAVELQVLARRELVVERGVLEDQADAAPHLVGLAGDIDAGDLDLPGGGLEQGAEDADGGRLAGAVGPQEAKDLTLRDIEVDAPNRLDLAVLLDQTAHLDHAIDITPTRAVATLAP